MRIYGDCWRSTMLRHPLDWKLKTKSRMWHLHRSPLKLRTMRFRSRSEEFPRKHSISGPMFYHLRYETDVEIARRWIVGARIAFVLSAWLATAQVSAPAKSPRLFPNDASGHQWIEFAADGFDVPVSGVVYETGNSPCCGVPLGGISTGCIDLDPIGTLGFCSIFNGYPRQPKLAEPFLGMS